MKKSFYHVFTLFGLMALLFAAVLAAAPAQPALAEAAYQDPTTPEPPIGTTLVVPDTGDTDIEVQQGDNFFVNYWWMFLLFGVLLIGLIIGLASRGGSHHHHLD